MSWRTGNTYTLDDVARAFQRHAAKFKACTNPYKPRRVAVAEAALATTINLHGNALTVPDEIRDALKAYIDAVEASIHPPKTPTATTAAPTIKVRKVKPVDVPDVTDPTDMAQVLAQVSAQMTNLAAQQAKDHKALKKLAGTAQPKKQRSSGSDGFFARGFGRR